MSLTEDGFIQPRVVDPAFLSTNVAGVCPFENEHRQNEDTLARPLYGHLSSHNSYTGYFLSTFAGHVAEEGYRDNGGSGGMVSWLIARLFDMDLIDGVLHVQEMTPAPEATQKDPRLFRYGISRSIEEMRRNAKSRYYPVEMADVLKTVRETPGRYAIVGVPCFLKAVRLLQKQDVTLGERLQYHIGLVCGHLKGTFFADMLAWQQGIPPASLSRINFRHKSEGRTANDYEVTAEGQLDGQVKTVHKPVSELYGYDWGAGLFKYQACDYCDDVFAELADVTIGDAWIPPYIEDGGGSNVVVVRSKLFHDLITQGMGQGKLALDPLPLSKVIGTQVSGLKHRREGLSYRLYLKDKAKEWRPLKRVPASRHHLSPQQQKIFAARVRLQQVSSGIFRKGLRTNSYARFKSEMDKELQKYYATYRGNIFQRGVNKLQKILGKR